MWCSDMVFLQVSSTLWAMGKINIKWDALPIRTRQAVGAAIVRTAPTMTPLCVANTIHGEAHTQYTIHNIKYAIYNTQYTIQNTQYTIHNTQHTNPCMTYSTLIRSTTLITYLVFFALSFICS
jgi:hypothetical protein